MVDALLNAPMGRIAIPVQILGALCVGLGFWAAIRLGQAAAATELFLLIGIAWVAWMGVVSLKLWCWCRPQIDALMQDFGHFDLQMVPRRSP